MIDQIRGLITYYLSVLGGDYERISIPFGPPERLILMGCVMIYDHKPMDETVCLFMRCFELYYGIVNREKVVENQAEINRRIEDDVADEVFCMASVLGEAAYEKAKNKIGKIKSVDELEQLTQEIYDEYFV